MHCRPVDDSAQRGDKKKPVRCALDKETDISTHGALRAIPAHCALSCMGKTFRHGRGDRGVFQRSQEVEHISDFWSHSWSAPAWPKIFTLLLYYNGLRGVIAGVIATTLCAWALQMSRFGDDPGAATAYASAVGQVAGASATLAVLLFWPPLTKVFLDKACIDQGDDDDAKRAGIVSLCYFIRRSQNMLVLWESSYFRRLWCVFELATRLKLLEMDPLRERPPIMRSVIHGFMTVGCWLIANVIVVASMLVMGDQMQDPSASPSDVGALLQEIAWTMILPTLAVVPLYHIWRGHVAQVVALEEQLTAGAFSIRETDCSCCKLQHTDPVSREQIVCDRVLIEAAVIRWFGSVDAFNKFITWKFEEFHVDVCVPYRGLVFVSMPYLLRHITPFVWLLQAGGDTVTALEFLCRGLGGTFLLIPILAIIAFKVIEHLGGSTTGCGCLWGMLRCALAACAATLPVVALWYWVLYILKGVMWAYVPLTAVYGGWLYAYFGRPPCYQARDERDRSAGGEAPSANAEPAEGAFDDLTGDGLLVVDSTLSV